MWNSRIAHRCWRFVLVAIVLLIAPSAFGGTIRMAIQKTGTVAWGLDVMRAHNRDKQAGLDIKTLELASPQAGKIALRGGTADVIVSDWLWVSRERDLGAKLVFYPYSTTLGAVMVRGDSPIRTLADLKGKTLGVAGGPIDKSWLLLQALAKQQGVDLKRDAHVVYGAPPLLAAKLRQGELDAMLNFWNLCVQLQAQGYRRLIGVEDMLPKFGVKGPMAMIGYVFDGAWAAAHADTVTRFLAVTREAQHILATSDAEWRRIAPLVHAENDVVLAAYRRYYGAGIPNRPIAEEEADAGTLYRVLAKLGGKALVGDGKELASGTFYRPAGLP